MDHPWSAILHIAGTTQSFFLFLYFWFQKDRKGQIFFALLMAVISVLIPIGYLYSSGEIIHYPSFSRVGFPLGSLVGPLFYLSMRLTLDWNFKFTPKHLVFFTVSLLEFLYLVPYYLSSRTLKIQYITEDLQNVHIECAVMSQISFFTNLLFFISIIFFLLKKYKDEKTWFNRNGKRNFIFIKLFLFTSIFFQIIFVSAVVVKPEVVNTNLITAPVSILILIIAYMVLIYSQKLKKDESISSIQKYEKDRMPDSDLMISGKNLEEHIHREKVYLDPDYSLILLANSLNLGQNKTSQIINRFFGKSFPDLMNTCRVQHAITLIQDERYREFNLLRIALESGFNSKSSFNSCFRKETGITPREYRNRFKKTP